MYRGPSVSSSSAEGEAYFREKARSTDFVSLRAFEPARGEGDLEMSESDAAGLDNEERVVARGDVGTELRPLEFPRCAGSSFTFDVLGRFLFPREDIEVAAAFVSSSCDRDCDINTRPGFP
jgi:hypothetical protein